MKLPFLFPLFAVAAFAQGEPATIRVFVALVDNQHQGIAPVPAKIGNGDDPAHNLYWGCDEALPPVFKRSGAWKLQSTAPGPKAEILERKIYLHATGKWRLVADAYRGSAIRECTSDFFTALGSDEPVASLPLVAYIGHDGLMEFALPETATAKRGPGREAIVLCCQSDVYFGKHLPAVNARPVLLTTQFMYPGGFLLLAALDGWTKKETTAQIRQRAAAAYARNQNISLKAALGVFTTAVK
jgi:hypothetical protein